MLIVFLVTVFGGLLSEAADEWMGQYNDAHLSVSLSLSVSACL